MTEPMNGGETRSWLEIEREDDLDEELEPAIDDPSVPRVLRALLANRKKSTLDRNTTFSEPLPLQG